MARFSKSDDSDDSDYNPQEGKTKKVKSTPSRKKAGASSLPTPGVTPTDPTFAAQRTLYQQGYATKFQAQSSQGPALQYQLRSPLAVQPLPMPPLTRKYHLNGMLELEDEVLNALLNFSRRGKWGHCSRDTADVWFYTLRLFFPAEEGYRISASDYNEQFQDDFRDEADIPSGRPITIQVWKQQSQFHPLHRQWVLTHSTPLLTIVCASVESSFSEYPASRFKNEKSQDVYATTPLQIGLYNQICTLLKQHNDLVVQGRNQASAMKSISGAVACGSMVRFFKVQAATVGTGWFRAYSAKGIDLVNGVPSSSLGLTERILMTIKDPGWKLKGAQGRMY